MVGDDFRFGFKRSGDYAMLNLAGEQLGLRCMNSYEVSNTMASSSAVRDAPRDMARRFSLALPQTGHVVHGRKPGAT